MPRFLLAAGVLICLSGTARALPPLKAPELPAELIKQFEALGFQYGHFVVGRDEILRFETALDRAPGEKPPANAVPGFGTNDLDDETMAKIPRTDRALGLGFPLSKISGAALKELARYPQLKILDLSFCKAIDDAALADLPRLDHLDTLELSSTRLTDAGLKELAKLERLQSLSIAHTEVTDEGLKALASLKSLRAIDLGSCKHITGRGVKELALGNGRLQFLSLSFYSRVGEGGPEQFSRFSDLEHLDLTWTPVTNAHLAEISGLTRLRVLVLKDCRELSEADLKLLAACRSLE